MSDNRTYVGRKIKGFQSSPQFDGFSRVVIVVSDEIEFTAGTELGRTLRLTNPWGTQQMAENILESVRGFQYQPYTAEGTFLDPSVELGDGITANNIYGGVYTQQIKFGPMMTATVAAPEDEEINHEYPYKSKPNKEITREAKMLRASLAIEANRITAEVTERKAQGESLSSAISVEAGRITTEITERKAQGESLSSAISVEAGRITTEITERKAQGESFSSSIKQHTKEISARVTKTGGNASSFGWVLNDSSWTINANNRAILKATKSGLEVYGKITATSGKIGGFDIQSNYLSYNNQTWGGTNSTGIYLGPSGFQLGKNFKVDNSGNLTAASGTFTGAVNAGNIRYGGNYGTFSGSGLSSGSISGSRLKANTVSTSYTSTGINNSLGRADAAYNVTTGVTRASKISTATLYVGGYGFSPKSISFKDYDGNSVYIYYWGW